MSEILERLRQGDLPDQAAEAIVNGLMPMEGEDLIVALFIIGSDKPAYLDRAQATFDSMPEGIKASCFEREGQDPELLDFFLRHFKVTSAPKSALLLNGNTPASAIAAAAPEIEPMLLDLAVNNQVKILEDPSIIDGLRLNPALSITQTQKLDEYGYLLLKNQISSSDELENLSPREIEMEAIAETIEFVKVFGKEMGPMTKGSIEEPEVETREKEKEDPSSSRDKSSKISVMEQLSSMSTPQKIQAAIKGDREVRTILIRDSNRLVCCAVVKSPRITDAEIEFYANLRNVQTDVLRLIAGNREWTKSYKVAHNLVRNPRTPIAQSCRLLPRLNKRDLRNLERDRGIPEALRTMAKRMAR